MSFYDLRLYDNYSKILAWSDFKICHMYKFGMLERCSQRADTHYAANTLKFAQIKSLIDLIPFDNIGTCTGPLEHTDRFCTHRRLQTDPSPSSAAADLDISELFSARGRLTYSPMFVESPPSQIALHHRLISAHVESRANRRPYH